MKPQSTFTAVIAALLLSIFSIQANAQHVNYGYDANGNRISRQYSSTFRIRDTSQSDPGADKIAAQYGIGVYPNPLMDDNRITVAIASASDKPGEEATVYVLDNTGKMLYSQKQNTTSPTELDLSGYAAGIYYIKVAIGKEELFYKVTKAK